MGVTIVLGSFVSTHSRPKAAASGQPLQSPPRSLFQHTAARRRLHAEGQLLIQEILVSTHSRPKAAALPDAAPALATLCFNTQPPEGGCNSLSSTR